MKITLVNSASPKKPEFLSAYIWAVTAVVLWAGIFRIIISFIDNYDLSFYALRYYLHHWDRDVVIVEPSRAIAVLWPACFLFCSIPYIGGMVLIRVLKLWHPAYFIIGAGLVGLLIYLILTTPHIPMWQITTEAPAEQNYILGMINYVTAGLFAGLVCWWRLNNSTKIIKV